jgi:hypothetical protein
MLQRNTVRLLIISKIVMSTPLNCKSQQIRPRQRQWNRPVIRSTRYLDWRNRQPLEQTFNDWEQPLPRWWNLQLKDKKDPPSRELPALIPCRSTHWLRQCTNIVNFQRVKDLHHRLCLDHLLENLPPRIWRIGKFLLVSLTGKIQEVILFPFTWGWLLTADHFSTTLSMNLLQTSSIHSMLQSVSLSYNLKKELKFKEVWTTSSI